MRRYIHPLSIAVGLFALVAIGLPGIVCGDDEATEDHGHSAGEAHGHADGGHEHEDDGHADTEHTDHAAGGGAHHPDTNQLPIFPNRAMGELFVFSLVFFCLYLVLAKRLAWQPLIAGLDARESRVNRALAEAEHARIEATKLLGDHQKHLDAVTEEVKEIIAQARGEAEQEKARIIAEAEAETTKMRDEAIAEIHAAREQALAGLDERIDSQVATATEHVLG